MKKRISIIVSLALFAAVLCGCSDKELKEEKAAQQVDELVQSCMDSRELWENEELLSRIPVVYYDVGYCFLDLDLDAVPELAVQYAGGTMRNCGTAFYSLKSGQPEPYSDPNGEPPLSGAYSISVKNLSLFTDEIGKSFYIQEYTLKLGAGYYAAFTDKLEPTEGKIVCEGLFTEESVGADSVVYSYLGQELSPEAYQTARADYFGKLSETELELEFISFSDWSLMNDEEKAAALKASYLSAII